MVRRYAALLMAQAAQRLWEEAKLGGFGTTAEGFYYDFDLPRAPSEEELSALEREMGRLAAARTSFSREEVSRSEAVRRFEARGERWRIEGLSALPAGSAVTLYAEGEWFDAVADAEDGETPESPPAPPAVKVLSAAGAYWNGNSANSVLQRVYGVAFADRKELDAYLARQAEAQKRDHRKLGKQLELFMFADEAPGMPFYLPKGTIVRGELERLSREFLQAYNYEEVRTPFIMNRQLWERSGHWEHYRDNMYFSELDGQHFAVKPMNCPGHMLMYKHKRHSYKELPIRLAEFGQVHRYEYSGALNGLFRVRTFCQDDAHLFVTPEQIEGEIKRTLELVRAVYGIFGFDYLLELSTRPDDSMGSDEQWANAETSLRRVLDASGLPYRLNPGDGAFYGPKIDFHIKDALGRSHQCGTIQLDFQMPEKFELVYIDEGNEPRTPVVIHRAVYGSIDRFLGILIEHYAGAFPLWLAPVQAIVLPVAEAYAGYAEQVRSALASAGIRVETDARNEKLGYRIREAQLQKIPYLAVVGGKEAESGTVQVRAFGEERQETFEADAFARHLQENIRSRAK
ncbi:threonine--tRNA ligase [Paenibacillus sp. TRM 82003]|nr:threonine--tRNA ligase [Paenibacillus sp. TRM 82003]